MEESQLLTGLTSEEVIASRAQHGLNLLTPKKRESLWRKFFLKFTDPLITILVVACVLSITISFYQYFAHLEGFSVFLEPFGILIAILLATGLAFIFEVKADREFAILNQVNDDEAVKVIRNGNTVEIPKREVVVGDVVLIETGNEIPADAELLRATQLSVDESTLTGEPLCHKSTDPKQFDKEATFPSNHVMRGTKVMEGFGTCRVFAVGDKTENGKVFTASQIDNSVETPLNIQLHRLSKLITRASYALAALIFAGRTILYFATLDAPAEVSHMLGYMLETLMIAVTVIVMAVPEGLPMAVTLSLAYSMRRMLKTHNLVRKMHACETMGATSVICTDKTGTLTQNMMQVHQTNFFGLPDQRLDGSPLAERVLRSLALNATATLDRSDPARPKVIGNPTEGALLLWLNQQGVIAREVREQADIIDAIPFSTERKFMATVEERNGRRHLYIKGAPEIVAALCNAIDGPLTQDQINEQLVELQNKAMRTLGFAYAEGDLNEEFIKDGELHFSTLSLIGIVAIADPVRSDVPAAIRSCISAGVGIKIVTGDTSRIAKEIGRQIGLWSDADTDLAIITGPEIESMTGEQLEERAPHLKIIARARPMDKKRLVEALQAKDEVVAVTGDGTNDAPALKAAHVGLSMGDGTSVAKEASDITIIDNSFASIVRAVKWGRSLYQNIQRFILFQLTVNVVACLIVLAGAFMGTQSPLTVTQILWVNLIMDTFAAMALASLPPTDAVMRDKPRHRQDFIITRPMAQSVLTTGFLFFAFLLGLLYLLQHSEVDAITDFLNVQWHWNRPHLSPYELSIFFTTFVFLQFWNLFNARAYATGRSALHFKECGGLLFTSLLILGGQVLIVSVGGEMFSVTPLGWKEWVGLFGATSVVLWIGELIRLLTNKRQRPIVATV